MYFLKSLDSFFTFMQQPRVGFCFAIFILNRFKIIMPKD